jgi:hypothetical protein
MKRKAAMYCLAADISKQLKWDGKVMDEEDWIQLFSAHNKGFGFISALEGDRSKVLLSQSVSGMTTKVANAVMVLIKQFGDSKGVTWSKASAKGFEDYPEANR